MRVSPISLLLVEDDALISEMYERIFSKEGIRTEKAANGEEALKKLESMSPKPDIIILDIILPKMSGIEVLDHLRNNPALKNIPVVVLSNLGSNDDMEDALSRGADMYLIKSKNDLKTIVQKIKRLIGE